MVKTDVLEVAPQIISGARWGLTAGADSAAVTIHWSRTARVEFNAGYAPLPAPAVQLLVGTLRLQNLGSGAAHVTGVQVEVAAAGGDEPPVSVAAECPLGATGLLAGGVTMMCRFAAPYGRNASGTVTARAVLAGSGGERSSRPRPFDFEQTVKRVNAGDCAVAADGFVSAAAAVDGGGGLMLAPNSTSRPAEAAAPQMICNGQTVSFDAKFGPYSSRSCGTYLVTYQTRINPISGDLPVASQAASANVRLTITGCPAGSGEGR